MPVPTGTGGTSAFPRSRRCPPCWAARCAATRCSCSSVPRRRPVRAGRCGRQPTVRCPHDCCSTRRRAPPTARWRSTGSSRRDDGSIVAVGLSEGGTEDSVLHVLHVAIGRVRRAAHRRHPRRVGRVDARRIGLLVRPLPGRRPVQPPHPLPPARRRSGRRPGRVRPAAQRAGVARRAHLAGRPPPAGRDARRLGPDRRPPARHRDGRVDHDHRGRRGADELRVRRRSAVGTDVARRAERPADRRRPSPTPAVEHWRTIVADATTSCSVGPTRRRRSSLVVASRAAVDSVERRAARRSSSSTRSTTSGSSPCSR